MAASMIAFRRQRELDLKALQEITFRQTFMTSPKAVSPAAGMPKAVSPAADSPNAVPPAADSPKAVSPTNAVPPAADDSPKAVPPAKAVSPAVDSPKAPRGRIVVCKGEHHNESHGRRVRPRGSVAASIPQPPQMAGRFIKVGRGHPQAKSRDPECEFKEGDCEIDVTGAGMDLYVKCCFVLLLVCGFVCFCRSL